MIEYALRDEIEARITEFSPKLISTDNYEYHVHATNVPEGAVQPHLVYAAIKTDLAKALDGYTGDKSKSFIYSIMTTKYGVMKSLTKKVKDFLISLPGTSIGTEQIYIQDISINNIDETWENELKVNRGIIDFTIYY